LNQLEAAPHHGVTEELKSPRSHFYVPPIECNEQYDWGWGEEIGFNEQSNEVFTNRFLVLPHEDIHAHDLQPISSEPLIDYFMSYVFMFDEYVASLEAKAIRKQALLEEARTRTIAAKESNETSKLQKLERV
jgi:hypothetical protein